MVLFTDHLVAAVIQIVVLGVSPFEWTRRIDQAAGATVTAEAASSKALGDK